MQGFKRTALDLSKALKKAEAAARSIAAHLSFATIGVKDTHAKVSGEAFFEQDKAICPNTIAAMAKLRSLLLRGLKMRGAVID